MPAGLAMRLTLVATEGGCRLQQDPSPCLDTPASHPYPAPCLLQQRRLRAVDAHPGGGAAHAGGVGAAGGTTDHVMTRCDPSMTRRRVCLLPMGVVTKVVVVVILFVTVCLAGRSPGRMMVWSLQ